MPFPFKHLGLCSNLLQFPTFILIYNYTCSAGTDLSSVVITGKGGKRKVGGWVRNSHNKGFISSCR